MLRFDWFDWLFHKYQRSKGPKGTYIRVQKSHPNVNLLHDAERYTCGHIVGYNHWFIPSLALPIWIMRLSYGNLGIPQCWKSTYPDHRMVLPSSWSCLQRNQHSKLISMKNFKNWFFEWILVPTIDRAFGCGVHQESWWSGNGCLPQESHGGHWMHLQICCYSKDSADPGNLSPLIDSHTYTRSTCMINPDCYNQTACGSVLRVLWCNIKKMGGFLYVTLPFASLFKIVR